MNILIFKTCLYSLVLAFASFNIFNFRVYGNFQEKSSDQINDISIEYLKNLPQNDYILGPGDTILIMVSRDYPELNTRITVDREGTINIPKLKKVYVQGLTTNELVKLLDEAYLEYIKFPASEVKVSSYRPIRVYVDGEVANPGLQTLSGALSIGANNDQQEAYNLGNLSNLRDQINLGSNDTYINDQIGVITNYFPTVYDAIRSAGGISRFSDLKEVEVIRNNSISSGGGRKKAILNFERLILEGDNTQNIRIYDGDFINIKKAKDANLDLLSKAARSNLNPKFINVYVSGRVQEAGNKKVAKTSTLNDAIAIAGGTKVIKGKVTFIRFNIDGTVEQRKIRYSKTSKRGTYKNPYLIDGDIVFVGQSFLSSSNEVISEVTAPLQGLFSAYGLLKVITE